MNITTGWFEERGGLHDARVVEAKVGPATVRITIDDEWANKHQPGDPPSPGTMIFEGAAVIAGDVASLAGGWLSEVGYRGSAVVFDFCDRDRVVINAHAAVWKPNRGS